MDTTHDHGAVMGELSQLSEQISEHFLRQRILTGEISADRLWITDKQDSNVLVSNTSRRHERIQVVVANPAEHVRSDLISQLVTSEQAVEVQLSTQQMALPR